MLTSKHTEFDTTSVQQLRARSNGIWFEKQAFELSANRVHRLRSVERDSRKGSDNLKSDATAWTTRIKQVETHYVALKDWKVSGWHNHLQKLGRKSQNSYRKDRIVGKTAFNNS